MRHIEGMTTRRMLRDGGLGEDAIDAKLARGELILHSRGTYRLLGAPDDRRRRLIGALLHVGAPVAVDDRDALWVAGRIDEPTGPIDLLVPHPRHPLVPDSVRLRSSTRFELAAPTRHGVVPATSGAWALTSAGKTSSRRDLAQLVTGAVGARWTSIDELQQVHDLRGIYPGSTGVRRLLEELAEEQPYSRTEQRLARACRRAGMTVLLNEPIRDALGRIIARGDLCLPEHRIIVEVDGPRHWLPHVAAADRVRDRLLRALGWTVIRFTVYEIDDDLAAVVQEILQNVAGDAAA